MKVKLATQVLSKSVAIALEENGDEEVLGTAKFCRMMKDFFFTVLMFVQRVNMYENKIISSSHTAAVMTHV